MFGWNRVRLGSHECSFYLLLDDSHVSIPAALPNLRALRRGGYWHTGTLAHSGWHACSMDYDSESGPGSVRYGTIM